MKLADAKNIEVGDKVTVKNYFGECEVLHVQEMGCDYIGFWLDNGDLVNHKQIESVNKA